MVPHRWRLHGKCDGERWATSRDGEELGLGLGEGEVRRGEESGGEKRREERGDRWEERRDERR